jgi:His/Glu/Gln/Arg/opine family amino acid ABC transporter permease subunit
MVGELAYAFINTFLIFFFTLIGALPFGMVVYFCKKSRFKPLKWLTEVYISIMRGTPLMLQVMVIYFAPALVFHFTIPGNWRFSAVVVAFIVNYAAYFAEIYRGGIEAIPNGQYEAAHVLGYSKVQTFFKIILPQLVKTILPSVTNEVITLVKDTSLAFALAYNEMFAIAKQIAAKETSFLPFVVAAVFYFIANYVVAFVMERIEKKFDYYK